MKLPILLIPVSLLVLFLQPDLIGAPPSPPPGQRPLPSGRSPSPQPPRTPWVQRLTTPLRNIRTPAFLRSGAFGRPILRRIQSILPVYVANWRRLLFPTNDQCQEQCTAKHGFYQTAMNMQDYLPASKGVTYYRVRCNCYPSDSLYERIKKDYEKAVADQYASKILCGSVKKARAELNALAAQKGILPIVFVTKEQLAQIIAQYNAYAARRRLEMAEEAARRQEEDAREAERLAREERTEQALKEAQEERRTAEKMAKAAEEAAEIERQARAALALAAERTRLAELEAEKQAAIEQEAEQAKLGADRQAAERAAAERIGGSRSPVATQATTGRQAPTQLHYADWTNRNPKYAALQSSEADQSPAGKPQQQQRGGQGVPTYGYGAMGGGGYGPGNAAGFRGTIPTLPTSTDEASIRRTIQSVGNGFIVIIFIDQYLTTELSFSLDILNAQFPNIPFIKADMSKCKGLASEYKVLSSPTFIVRLNRMVLDRWSGNDSNRVITTLGGNGALPLRSN